MTPYVLTIIILIVNSISNAQTFRHYDFLGAGHIKEITISSSSSEENANKTVEEFKIQNDAQLKDASRFLAQCTFGADMATINMVAAMGYEAWLSEQFQLPLIPYSQIMNKHFYLYENHLNIEGSISARWVRSAWLQNLLTSPDILRQRMTFALSEIMVISNNTHFFETFGQIGSTYYDMLYNNAFGKYRNLLYDVTMSPAMGIFLSHYRNHKEDLINNTHPDENYAREVLQLFSIGLWKLNQNGTKQTDNLGNFIPTFNNYDISEMAQVFTGLGDGRANGNYNYIGVNSETADIIKIPMKMYDNAHDKSDKHLINNVVLPADQAGMDDINQTMDLLAGHNTTAPFISRSLIRFFTTSNPSPEYVERVASVFNPFNDNNFQEVISAILLDPEARNCEPIIPNTFGKLREPLVRYLNYLKAFHLSANENQDYVFEFNCMLENVGQSPLSSPTVFNFFKPEFTPNNNSEWNNLKAPEFQILNSNKAITVMNEMDKLAIKRAYFYECIDEYYANTTPGSEIIENDYYADYSNELNIADNGDQLINRLDILLANGLLSTETKDIIKNAINQPFSNTDKIRMAIYLIMISPDYVILK